MSNTETRKAELLDKWGVRLGQVWELGGGYVGEEESVPPHYVAVGQAEDRQVWDALLDQTGRDRVDNIIFSPPYADRRRGRYPGSIRAEDWPAWLAGSVAPVLADYLEPDGSAFINVKAHAANRRLTYDKRAIILMEDTGWVLWEDYIWLKTAYPGRADYRLKNAWEPIYQMTRTDAKPLHTLAALGAERERIEDGRGFRAGWITLAKDQGDPAAWGGVEITTGIVMPSNVIIAPPDPAGVPGVGHAARFPRKIPRFFMTGWRAGLWADPFIGSGTSLIEAEAQGIQCIGIDLDPWAITVLLERWELTYGSTPSLYITEL